MVSLRAAFFSRKTSLCLARVCLQSSLSYSTSTRFQIIRKMSLLSHPINTALLLYLLYLFQRIFFPSASVPRTPPTEFKAGYSWMPRAHTPSLLFTTYTPRTLANFNGHDGGRILFAIGGVVFDVTGAKGFYGPGEHSVPWSRGEKGPTDSFSRRDVLARCRAGCVAECGETVVCSWYASSLSRSEGCR